MARKQDKTDRNKLTLKMIAWMDHHDIVATWTSREHIECREYPIVSVGWIVDEDEEKYVLARDLDTEDGKTVGGVVVILKGTVVKQWTIGDIKH